MDTLSDLHISLRVLATGVEFVTPHYYIFASPRKKISRIYEITVSNEVSNSYVNSNLLKPSGNFTYQQV
jgi:hypothetical protein